MDLRHTDSQPALQSKLFCDISHDQLCVLGQFLNLSVPPFVHYRIDTAVVPHWDVVQIK